MSGRRRVPADGHGRDTVTAKLNKIAARQAVVEAAAARDRQLQEQLAALAIAEATRDGSACEPRAPRRLIGVDSSWNYSHADCTMRLVTCLGAVRGGEAADHGSRRSVRNGRSLMATRKTARRPTTKRRPTTRKAAPRKTAKRKTATPKTVRRKTATRKAAARRVATRRGSVVPRGKVRAPRTFRDVVDLAEADPAYARRLKQVARRARTGNARAVREFLKEFKFTPSVLQLFEPKPVAQKFLTTLPCFYTVITATCFLSCFSKTMRGYHWFCKEAR